LTVEAEDTQRAGPSLAKETSRVNTDEYGSVEEEIIFSAFFAFSAVNVSFLRRPAVDG
jgi:hypothetical protein